MALTDADPIPLKNTAFRVTFYIIDADGDPVASATINSGLASGSGKALVSKDGAASVNSTNSVTEIDNGWYYLDLSATEMNADTVAVMVRTTTSGAKNTPIVLYPASTVDAVVVTGSVAGFISGLRARGIQTADLSDADLTTIIGEALYEFSRFRPILSDRTFLTVADQQLYTWSAIGDSSGLQAVLVVWNPYQTGDEWN
ncbi:MAG TPA: hypothetical protein VJL08_03640, partial [Dehalococcoidia bacterium]|nr:hypothetical protein [Dehalococcoidia bacterium]